MLTIDGVEMLVVPGTAAFIPGDAEHSIWNDGQADLRVFYVFPTDSFKEIVYRL